MNSEDTPRQTGPSNTAGSRFASPGTPGAGYPDITQILQDASNHIQCNRLQDAKALYQQALHQQPDHPVALHVLGLLSYRDGHAQDAVELIERAIAAKPDFAEACNNAANIYYALGEVDTAVARFRQAIASDPKLIEAHCNLGMILQSQHRLEEAKSHYQAALFVKPDFATARTSLGEVLHIIAQDTAARQADTNPSAEAPLQHQAQTAIRFYNQAIAYQHQGKLDEAIDHYQQAIAAKPDFTEAHNNLGDVLTVAGRLEEALACFLNTISLNPASVHACNNLGNTFTKMGRMDEALASFEEALRIDPHNAGVHSNLLFMLCYRSDYDPGTLFAEHVRWGKMHGRNPAEYAAIDNAPDAKKRLRVGYVSADFHNHSVGYFIERVLTNHDQDRFEIFCYANQTINDDLTFRLRQHIGHWREISGKSDDAVVGQIRADGIDILIDLSGHTEGNRLTVFARKPAPVQATWLGYPNTTGLKAMDYIIADRFLIPPQEERYYVEQVVRLPNSCLCFTPPDSAIEPGPLPALVTTTPITFGCFNNTAKLTEAVISCWSRLLHALPEAQLYLKYKPLGEPAIQQHYHDLFALHGIAPERVRFAGKSPSRDHVLAAYREVDIGLDPFPYNGCTTTMEALWMGVPVVTLRGDRYAGHVGESIVMNLGLEQCVADSEESYIAKAIALASDLPRLAAHRSRLRAQLLNSALCDGFEFVRNLEDIYSMLWKSWCQSHKISPAE